MRHVVIRKAKKTKILGLVVVPLTPGFVHSPNATFVIFFLNKFTDLFPMMRYFLEMKVGLY